MHLRLVNGSKRPKACFVKALNPRPYDDNAGRGFCPSSPMGNPSLGGLRIIDLSRCASYLELL
jgi:hypothetical protein